MIKLLSRIKYPNEVLENIEVLLNSKVYKYKVETLIVNKFEWMLNKKMGFKAFNYLKRFVK